MRRVLVADNHPLFRAGMRAAIEALEGCVVVGEVADGEACLAQAALLEPDIVTVDLNMPGTDGYDVLERLRRDHPRVRTVVVSMHADRPFVEKAFECGAAAFVAKEDTGSELGIAFDHNGTAPFMSSSSGKSEPMLRIDADASSPLRAVLDQLTATERRILLLVAHSKSSREIAAELGIAERTVHTHRNNICMKTDTHGANGLLRFALANRVEIEALLAGRA